MQREDHAGAASPRPGLTIGAFEAARVTELLELLAELPSTPGLLAEEARYRAAELAAALPDGVHRLEAGERLPPGPVVLDALTTTGLAGLLELLAGLPSTPPDVADDALRHADILWALVPSPS